MAVGGSLGFFLLPSAADSLSEALALSLPFLRLVAASFLFCDLVCAFVHPSSSSRMMIVSTTGALPVAILASRDCWMISLSLTTLAAGLAGVSFWGALFWGASLGVVVCGGVCLGVPVGGVCFWLVDFEDVASVAAGV